MLSKNPSDKVTTFLKANKNKIERGFLSLNSSIFELNTEAIYTNLLS
jgi:hypothetical protein